MKCLILLALVAVAAGCGSWGKDACGGRWGARNSYAVDYGKGYGGGFGKCYGGFGKGYNAGRVGYGKGYGAVGYGKGFYDRFLQNLGSKTIKIGLSFFPPELLITNIDEKDIKLDYCVSPEKIFNFL